MNLELSEDQKAWRARLRRRNIGWPEDPAALFRRFGDEGLAGLPVRTDPLTAAVALEALGYGCRDAGKILSLGAHLAGAVVPLWKFGESGSLKDALGALASGARIGALAVTEPRSGSDAFRLETTARREGDGFRLSGTKTFVTNGPTAHHFLLLAALDGKPTAFLVNGDAGGLLRRPLETAGLGSCPLGEIRLENVPVAADAVVGKPGSGALVFQTAMDWERTLLFAAHVGMMDRILEETLEHCRVHRVGEGALGGSQAVGHRLADLKTRLEAGRWLVYRAAWSLDRSRDASLHASLAKLHVSECLESLAREALRLRGKEGYLGGSPQERDLRDALAATLYSGTSDIQRNLIARWILPGDL